MLELEGLELMLSELEPVEPLCSLRSPACHSERESCPSWFLSSLLNSSLEELEDEVPPADDEEGEDDLLLCDTDGEDEDPELLFESPAA